MTMPDYQIEAALIALTKRVKHLEYYAVDASAGERVSQGGLSISEAVEIGDPKPSRRRWISG